MLHFRIFSRKHNLYTNSPSWPSNQRSTSDWVLSPNGEILELVYFGAQTEEASIEIHNARDFDVEPWTGYFDSKGGKIYCGDILKLSCFNLDYEVVWSFDRFKLRTMYDASTKIGDDDLYPWGSPIDMATNYEVVGNIHGVKYSDV